MSQLARIRPKYVSVGVTNSTDQNVDASIFQRWDVPPIKVLSDYVVAIERMEIHTNCIPFYDPLNDNNNGDFIEIRYQNMVNKADEDANVISFHLSPSEICYNIWDLFGYIEANEFSMIYYVDGDTTNAVATNRIVISQGQLKFGLDGAGRVTVTIWGKTDDITGNLIYANQFCFQKCYVKFPQDMNMILGFNKDCFITGKMGVQGDLLTSTNNATREYYNKNKAYSIGPRIDCGDQFNHILLTSTLPVISDTIESTESDVLTDISKNSTYAISINQPNRYNNGSYFNTDAITDPNGVNVGPNGSSWVMDIRGKLIYQPYQKRLLDLISSESMRYLTITAFYVDNDGNAKKVKLPPGGTFQVKLGFFMK